MSTVLVVAPDYASHYFPLSAVAAKLRHRGHRVVVATGPGLKNKVLSDRHEYVSLILGPGSNPGLIRLEDQSSAERSQLDEFFAATREGMIPTLLHQARNRQRDLLHEPRRVAANLEQIIDSSSPDLVLVDQLAFVATAALRGLRQPFVSFHPGHPSAISVSRPYGYPPRVPRRLRVEQEDLAELEEVCLDVVGRFTAEYNEAIAAIDRLADAVSDAFAAVSPLRTLVNYPAPLGGTYGLPASTRYIGSSVRTQDLPDDLRRRRVRPGRARIYASLGTFFSERSDILAKLVAGFRGEPVELILASGVTPIDQLGEIPAHWIVADYLPQPALIRTADLVITHGGNNTVTEALTAGVPLLVGPLSTDQFAAAADTESAGLGLVFDPNFDDAATIAELAHTVLAGDAVPRAADMGRQLRARSGPSVAAALVEESMGLTAAV